jgi:hypothetical protein
MKNKNLIILVVCIFVVSLFIGFFYFKNVKQSSQNTNQEQIIDGSVQVTQELETKDNSLISIEGIVTEISKGWIEIQNGEIKNGLPLKGDVTVSSMFGAKEEAGTLGDIKKDQKVLIMIDPKNSDVMAIQIQQNN